MIVTIVDVAVKQEYLELFIAATLENHRQSIKEKENLRFDILQHRDDPAAFTFYEAYATDEAVAAHKTTSHYLKWRDTVEPMMARPPQRNGSYRNRTRGSIGMETLNPFTISGLPGIVFGAGTFSRISGIVQSCGRHALVITGGESLKKTGRLDSLIFQMKQADIRFAVESVRGEPSTQMIDALATSYRGVAIDVVVAVGGGSVIDCGKALSAMLIEEGPVREYLEDVGNRKPSGSRVKFIAVPSTAGTGSEATKNAVICDWREGYKKSLRHDAYVPDVAVIDPELTLSAPPSVTIACGLDAAAQLIESYTSVRANIFTDSLVLKALDLLSASLLPVCSDENQNIGLRANLSYAALISGIALSQAGLGTVHGLAGPLGGLLPVPHGVACGKLLFPVMTFVVKKIMDENNPDAQRRFADLGRIMTGQSGAEDAPGCKLFLGALHRWSQTLKLPPLSSFGMTAAHMEKVISLADNKNSPARLSPKEMKVILETVR